MHKKSPGSPMIFCWDGKSPTWRHKLRPSYKGQRPYNPEFEKMAEQIDVLLPMLEELNFYVVKIDGVEADDIIGILAKRFSQEGRKVRICSNDKDMYQLVSEKVMIWSRQRQRDGSWQEQLIDLMYVKNWLQASPSAIIDIRAMAGDGADNLKGLPGIGPVKAVKLYQEGVRPSIPKTKNLLPMDLQAHWPRVLEEYKMARIITDVDAEVWTDVQKEKLHQTIDQIVAHPERELKVTDQMKEKFYLFIGKYELEDIFKDRSKFWEMV
jgi:DNA polymerase-1